MPFEFPLGRLGIGRARDGHKHVTHRDLVTDAERSMSQAYQESQTAGLRRRIGSLGMPYSAALYMVWLGSVAYGGPLEFIDFDGYLNDIRHLEPANTTAIAHVIWEFEEFGTY